MQDISALTIPQIKAELTKLEVPFKSKMHKDELALLLENALIKAAQVTTPTSEPTDGLEIQPCENPEPHGPHDWEGTEAVTLEDVEFYCPGEPTQTEWPATPVSEEVAAWDEVGADQARIYAETMSASMNYPTNIKAAHMPNSERVQKYARQRGQSWPKLDAAKLTPKQMRRVRKNANKHGEGFMYSAVPKHYRSPMGGYSLLARTPEGMGIFHQFSY